MDHDGWTMNPGPGESREFAQKFEAALSDMRGAGPETLREVAEDIFRMGYEAGWESRAAQDRD